MSFGPAGVVTFVLSGPQGTWAIIAATPVPIACTTAFGVRSIAYAACRRAAEVLEIQTGMGSGRDDRVGQAGEPDDGDARARCRESQIDLGPAADGCAVLAA